jgi:7-cyano-7-deazaguanine synthase
MTSVTGRGTLGVLMSGGLDSAILVGHLLFQGRSVQPFYIRSHLVWESAELAAAREFLLACRTESLAELVTLDLPLDDLYKGHWSITGECTPPAGSPDEAVFLPGRNALLLIKAALWCQLHGIEELALAPLGTSPFADATAEFFEAFQAVLARTCDRPVRIVRPFEKMTKREVMQLGRELPLALTFSCISPRGGLHCGACNKCGERQAAFREAGLVDRTRYAP